MSTSKNEELMNETELGHTNEVKRLLTDEVDVNYQDERGRSPLMSAVQQNNIQLAKLLMEAGGDVNLRDNMKLTPFICAAANGFHEILEAGTHYGADVALVNRFGGTALLPSSEKGFLKAVDVAIKAGVPVNHINDLGWTGLQEAVVLGDGGVLYTLIIKMLMNNGADATTKDHDNKTAIDWAKEKNQEDILEVLQKNNDQNKPGEKEIAAIMELISNNKYDEALDSIAKAKEESENLTYDYLKGYTFTLLNRYDEGMEVFNEALRRGEGNPEFYFYIANALREQKKADEALAIYDEAIEQDPSNFFFRYHKSNYLRELGKHEEAIKEMDKLLENDPNRYDYLFHKANSLRVLGQTEEADRLLEEFKQK